MEISEMKEAFGEVLTERDAEIKKEIAEELGPIVAERVEDAVKAARVDDMRLGRKSLDDESKKAFAEDMKNIAGREKAAYLTVNDQTGGYLVPTEVHTEIMRIASTVGLVARDARRFPVADIEIPTYTGAVMQGSYVGEDEAGSETQNDIGVARLKSAQWMEIFRVSNKLIQKANVSVGEWLMGLVGEGLAYRLDREGFTGGTYAGSPFKGLLASSDVTVQTLGSGLTGFEDLTPAEASEAIGAVDTAALNNGAFYFHRTVWAQIRAQKDATSGEYVFRQDHSFANHKRENGIQPVGDIWGYPVYTTDVLPAYSASAASTKFGVFGNLNLALAFGEDGPMDMARSGDAVIGGASTFERNQTAFRFTHQHAVSLMLPSAAVVLKTAAS